MDVKAGNVVPSDHHEFEPRVKSGLGRHPGSSLPAEPAGKASEKPSLWYRRGRQKSGGLVEAQHDIEVLNSLTSGALAEVVDRGQDA